MFPVREYAWFVIWGDNSRGQHGEEMNRHSTVHFAKINKFSEIFHKKVVNLGNGNKRNNKIE